MNKQECIEQLTDWLTPTNGEKTTIYTITRHVSASGMSRNISAFCIKNNEIVELDYFIGRITGFKHSKNGGLIIKGCGMDMGFHLVYTLSRALYENNIQRPDNDGGYILNQKWL
jgi:hypothetical protein